MEAFGMVEVFGFSTSIVAADAAAKAADIKIIAIDNNKPKNPDEAPIPVVMTIKMEGEVSAVKAGVETASQVANDKGLFICADIIPRPGVGTEKLAFRNGIARKVIHILPQDLTKNEEPAEKVEEPAAEIEEPTKVEEPAKVEAPTKAEEPAKVEVKAEPKIEAKAEKTPKPSKFKKTKTASVPVLEAEEDINTQDKKDKKDKKEE